MAAPTLPIAAALVPMAFAVVCIAACDFSAELIPLMCAACCLSCVCRCRSLTSCFARGFAASGLVLAVVLSWFSSLVSSRDKFAASRSSSVLVLNSQTTWFAFAQSKCAKTGTGCVCVANVLGHAGRMHVCRMM